MKVILKPIGLFILAVFIFAIGTIYSILYFIYDPKALIEEKKDAVYKTKNKINWIKTLWSVDFWCPFLES